MYLTHQDSIGPLKAGIPVAEGSLSFDFSHAKNKEEYEAVLALRFKAYNHAKKVRPDTTAADMADEFDHRSRIMIAKQNAKIIGSVRIIFHGPTDILSYGRYFNTPPKQLPERRDYVEASRMCVDPDFQGLGIFYHLAAHMVLETLKSGRRYIVGGSTGKTTKKWEKCGFKKLGVKYKSKDIGDLEHDLILLDARRVALGDDINFEIWKKFFSHINTF